jgi:hypothetical protein
MERDSNIARPSLRVFGLLFVAYVVAQVALLLFVYSVAPSTPVLLAEVAAIAGGGLAARVALVVWRRTVRA